MKDAAGLKFIMQSFHWEVNIKLDCKYWIGGVMVTLSSCAWSSGSWALVYIEVPQGTARLHIQGASRPIGWSGLIADSGVLFRSIGLLTSGHTKLSEACCEVLQSLAYCSCDIVLGVEIDFASCVCFLEACFWSHFGLFFPVCSYQDINNQSVLFWKLLTPIFGEIPTYLSVLYFIYFFIFSF